MTAGMGAIFAGFFGALVGSFLNVVGYRLPRKESLVAPRSRCPNCEAAIKPYDNVPIVSWLALRGKCRNCGHPISKRYPLVELATALLCAAVVLDKGFDEDALLGLAFVVLLVPVTTIDLDYRLIPNVLMGIGAITAVALVLITDAGSIGEHALSALAGGGFFLLAAIAYPAGMGMGDVKLAGVMGLFLGREVGAALLIALIAGSVIGLAIIAYKGSKEGRKTAIPFGPFLALGGITALFAGDDIVDWYLSRFT